MGIVYIHSHAAGRCGSDESLEKLKYRRMNRRSVRERGLRQQVAIRKS